MKQMITIGNQHYAFHKNDPMTKLTDYIRVIDDDKFKDKMTRECEKLVTVAINYLKKVPGGVEQSGLSKQDFMDAVDTVHKGIKSAGYSKAKEQAMEREFTLPQ